MKNKTLIAVALVLAFLFLFSVSNAAITTVPWRYNTTTDKLWQYPSTTAQVGIGTTTPFQPLTVVGNTWITGPFLHVGDYIANSPINASAAGIEVTGNDNTIAGVQIQVVNNSAGTSAYNCYSLNNNLADATVTHFGALCQNSSAYSDTTFGTGLAIPNQLSLQNTDGPLSLIASTSTSPGYISLLTGGTATTKERLRVTSAGNVGIGTTTPATLLTVAGEGLFTGTSTASCFSVNGAACLTSGSGGSGTVGTSTAETANYFPRWSTTNGAPALLTGTSSLFQLSGNIGIATTTPSQALTVVGNEQINSTSTTALNIQGANVPTFQVDTTAASAAAGLQIVGGNAMANINAISTGAAAGIQFATKGNQNIIFVANGGTKLQFANSANTYTNSQQLFNFVAGVVATTKLLVTAPADTGMTAGTEAILTDFNQAVSRQHASNTTIALQRDFRIRNGIHAFASAGGTITQAAAVSIDGPDSAGGNATLTNSAALYIPTSTLTASTTNSFGIQIVAATGATNNYAASTSGRFVANGLTTSSATQTVNICGSTSDGGELIADTVACLVSAARYKENVATSTVGLDELMQLRPVSFTWKKDFNKDFLNDPNKNGVQYSLIADEVMKVDPKLVVLTTASSTFEGKTYAPGAVQGLADVNHWVSVIVAWLQEIVHRQDAQQVQIDQLQAQVTALQAELTKVKK